MFLRMKQTAESAQSKTLSKIVTIRTRKKTGTVKTATAKYLLLEVFKFARTDTHTHTHIRTHLAHL